MDEPDERFIIELEFVQNLANAGYLHYLAQNKYFEDERFINYLKYLRYWKEPPYITHITFPHCLAFLEALIDNPKFRKELSNIEFRDYVHQQQFFHWLHKPPDGANEEHEPSSSMDETK